MSANAHEPPSSREKHPLLGKTTTAIAVMLVCLAIPYASPRLARYRVARAPWDRAEVAETPTESREKLPELTAGEAHLKESRNEATVSNALPPELDPQALAKTAGSLAVEDPSGAALDAFYADLAKTASGDPSAVTRILHYGDSVITSDFVSGTMRRKMQAKYGDSGHGFILIANPWEWYFHNDVVHHATAGWDANRITGPLTGDGMYGLGGVTFHGEPGASATFATADRGEFGRKVSRFDIYYLEHPGGGDAQVIANGKVLRFSTKGDVKASRVHSVDVADGAAQLTVRAWGNGALRLFGVALERSGPGVTYDALGANGARIKLWEAMNAAHWADQMALRKPSLVILQFGTNESEDGAFDPAAYERSLGTVLSRIRAAAPHASVLVAAPLDRAERTEGGLLRTRRVIVRLVESQRRAALANGCGFWNTFEAMGGEGSMAKWVKANPQLAAWDLTHPTPAGAEVIGDLLFKALVSGYEAYGSRRGR